MHTWNSYFIQDSNSPNMDQLIFFHDLTLMIIIIITSCIMYMFYFLIMNKLTNRFMTNEHMIELIWTITPMLTLLFIASPSLKILYLLEETSSMPIISVKIIGHQWYWQYEMSDYMNIEFESFMQNLDSTSPLWIARLMDVDNRLILPINSSIRLLFTSDDVIHSWTIPSLGIKMDATPGRINQALMLMNRPGIFFGQCSEICGANHSFMPIMIESTNLNNFINWMKSFN
uniref:Cytochrome c oxidase subunit 2 n=3 Tax=Antodynerus TaxID=2612822 RepID=A0A6M9AX02_9HYME|nr:cytochrome c oxidase subunit II [Antodynerus aff. limbatus YN]QKK69222.1 cytochrome c oxidase subunit II [Antodynerus aff. limbatus GX]QKK69235.1 cytochrome c oxidase subunit II [Antodynerus aff. limbatus XZ]QKK69248.1 cytochrome c oxidase subunit II [Antodynerus aff. limbatus YN]